MLTYFINTTININIYSKGVQLKKVKLKYLIYPPFNNSHSQTTNKGHLEKCSPRLMSLYILFYLIVFLKINYIGVPGKAGLLLSGLSYSIKREKNNV